MRISRGDDGGTSRDLKICTRSLRSSITHSHRLEDELDVARSKDRNCQVRTHAMTVVAYRSDDLPLALLSASLDHISYILLPLFPCTYTSTRARTK
jgi:hypothetical protein